MEVYPLTISPIISQPPVPTILFEFGYFRVHIWVRTYSIFFLWLILLNTMTLDPAMLLQKQHFTFFKWLNILLHIYTHTFSPSSVNGPFRLFQYLGYCEECCSERGGGEGSEVQVIFPDSDFIPSDIYSEVGLLDHTIVKRIYIFSNLHSFPYWLSQFIFHTNSAHTILSPQPY